MESGEIREVLSKLEDTSSEPGDLPAQRLGQEEDPARRRVPSRADDRAWLMGWETGVLGGLIFGLLAGALIVLGITARRE